MEAVGFLVLVFTCASVREPLVLLRMLRQEPLAAAVYARPAMTPRSLPCARLSSAALVACRWPASEALLYPDAAHGGLGPLCKWETDPDCEYRVLPVSTVERVCAVVPHVRDDAAALPLDYAGVVHW